MSHALFTHSITQTHTIFGRVFPCESNKANTHYMYIHNNGAHSPAPRFTYKTNPRVKQIDGKLKSAPATWTTRRYPSLRGQPEPRVSSYITPPPIHFAHNTLHIYIYNHKYAFIVCPWRYISTAQRLKSELSDRGALFQSFHPTLQHLVAHIDRQLIHNESYIIHDLVYAHDHAHAWTICICAFPLPNGSLAQSYSDKARSNSVYMALKTKIVGIYLQLCWWFNLRGNFANAPIISPLLFQIWCESMVKIFSTLRPLCHPLFSRSIKHANSHIEIPLHNVLLRESWENAVG